MTPRFEEELGIVFDGIDSRTSYIFSLSNKSITTSNKV